MTIFEHLVICTHHHVFWRMRDWKRSSDVCLLCACYITHDIHDIHTTLIGIIGDRIQTACVHECQGLEGRFHMDRGEGQ